MKKAISMILFMLIISTVFITALAILNETTRERIELNQKIEFYQSVLYGFNLLPPGIDGNSLAPGIGTADLPWREDQVLQSFNTHIQLKTYALTSKDRQGLDGTMLPWNDSIPVYIGRDSVGNLIGYGILLYGKGLWGSIQAFGVIAPDFQRMVGIDFIHQSETPGLGARIMEEWFKRHFRGLDISSLSNNSHAVRLVSKKTTRNLETPTSDIEAITGASMTSKGVLDMVNLDIHFYVHWLSQIVNPGVEP